MRRWIRGLLLSGLLLALFGLGTSGGPGMAETATAQTSPQPAPPGAYLTEFLAKTTTPPLRDNYALNARLRAGRADLPRTTTKRTYKTGDVETFTVMDLEQKRPYEIKATVVNVTPHLYMFVDNNASYSRSALSNLATVFEEKVYPTTRRYFGEEASPGVDSDPHLVILNTPLKLAAGYFSSDDLILRPVNPSSNEREMFYIGLPPDNANTYLSVLSHEFQHMIYNHSLPNQDIWVNEGSSVLSQVLNGYGSGGYEVIFMGRPNTQLNTWACGSCGTPRYYGAGFTWLSYLEDHYGFETVRSISQNGKGLVGLNSMDYALFANGQAGQSSETVFKQFVLANYLNRRTADPLYNYKQIGSRVEQVTALATGTKTDEINQWAAGYYSVQGSDKGFTLDFQGQPTTQVAGPGPKSGSYAWWSNRGDGSDMTLTRSVDLSNTDQATFKLSLWVEAETNYDWFYVEASTDEGKTWQVLPGAKYTTSRDPTGKAYGPGITGQTTATGLDLNDTEEMRATWVQESYDLAKYAGQKIKLRLEYLTDEAYNRQGVLLDDFEISGTGWKDDVETDEGGWEASGFMRSNMILPQRYWVQVIRQDGLCGVAATTDLAHADNGQSCVQEIAVDAAGTGRQTFPYRQAIVVVAPYAVKTLLPAKFSLTVRN